MMGVGYSGGYKKCEAASLRAFVRKASTSS